MAPSRLIKCRVCPFTVPAVRNRPGGGKKLGWGAMLAHVADAAEREERHKAPVLHAPVLADYEALDEELGDWETP